MGWWLVAGCRQPEAELGCTDGNWSLVGCTAGTVRRKAMGFVVGEPLGLTAAVALGRAEREKRRRIHFRSES